MDSILITRVSEKYERTSKVRYQQIPLFQFSYYPNSWMFAHRENQFKSRATSRSRKQNEVPLTCWYILVAGTSDLYVAEEAQGHLQHCGINSVLYVDIGVAGLHRLLGRLPEIQQHSVLIVVAGMEAPLPSVVAGLVSSAIVAVPTSVGYGSHLKVLLHYSECSMPWYISSKYRQWLWCCNGRVKSCQTIFL